ncbi:MAG: doubled protein [Bacillales bacterium]|jgi:predicted CXXCH cytochrome family protein|nr:doubled protein [Bacillales bacterium]
MKYMKEIIYSLIIVLMIICIPQIVSATAPNKPTSLQVKQTENAAVEVFWVAPTSVVTEYAVSVKDGMGAVVANVNSPDTIEKIAGLNLGTRYSVQVTAKNLDGESLAISKGFTISNYVEQTAANGGLLDPIGVQSLNLLNGQKMHGDYQNNTNTCANCHSTHQAKSETGLLKSATVYEACISCHDGSLGFYNIFETDMSKDNGSGTFGGSHAGNMSIHLSTGNMAIDTAPGATIVKEADGSTIKSEFLNGKWSNDFTCTSCHNPHGSSTDRLLQTDPNGYSRMERHLVNGVYYGGLIKDKIEVTNAGTFENIPNTITAWLKPAEPNGTTDVIPKDAPAKNYKALKFPISLSAIQSVSTGYNILPNDGGWVIQIYKYDKYLETWNPIKFKQLGPFSGDGLDLLTAASVNLGGWKAPADPANPEDGEKLAEGYLSIGWNGYIKVPNSNIGNIAYVTNITTLFDFEFEKTNINIDNGDIHSYTYKVDHAKTIADQSNVAEPAQAQKAKSNLNQFNEWCATCHIGFNVSSEQKEATGSTIVYTHHSSSEDDQLPCVQCHYSHGTDSTWMKGADGLSLTELMAVVDLLAENADFTTADGIKIKNLVDNQVQKANILDYLTDINTSSALKRYTNTTSCFGCHGNDLPSH